MGDPAALRRFLDDEARRLGFSAVGVTGPDENARAAAGLDAFVAEEILEKSDMWYVLPPFHISIH